MSTCNDTACSNCKHINVCKFKEDFLKAQAAVNDVTVPLGDNRLIRLRDIKWIPAVMLPCDYYEYNGGGIR